MEKNEGVSAGGRKPAAAFLAKLFEILEIPEFKEFIDWQPDGQSFLIKKVEDFSRIVLPQYYKHNNFQSFVRQLNMYSFSKTRHDANWREFKQCYFQRGRPDLLPFIKRKTQISHRPEHTRLSRQSSGASMDGSSSVINDGSSYGTGSGDNSMKGKGVSVDSCKRTSTEKDEDGSEEGAGGMDVGTGYAECACTCREDVEWLKMRVGTLDTQLWVIMEKYNDLMDRLNSMQEIPRDRGMSTGSSQGGYVSAEGDVSNMSNITPPRTDIESTSSMVELLPTAPPSSSGGGIKAEYRSFGARTLSSDSSNTLSMSTTTSESTTISDSCGKSFEGTGLDAIAEVVGLTTTMATTPSVAASASRSRSAMAEKAEATMKTLMEEAAARAADSLIDVGRREETQERRAYGRPSSIDIDSLPCAAVVTERVVEEDMVGSVPMSIAAARRMPSPRKKLRSEGSGR